jgi:hypothetical protein
MCGGRQEEHSFLLWLVPYLQRIVPNVTGPHISRLSLFFLGTGVTYLRGEFGTCTGMLDEFYWASKTPKDQTKWNATDWFNRSLQYLVLRHILLFQVHKA